MRKRICGSSKKKSSGSMKQKKNKNSALLAFEYLGGEVQEKVEVDLAPYEENEFVTGQERTLKHFSD